MCLTCLGGTMMVGPAPASAPDIFTTALPEVGWTGSAEPLGGSIRWTGCAGFVLTVGDTSICIDPFVSNPGFVDAFFRHARSDEARVARTFAGVSAAFIGHSHWDHAMDVAVVARSGAQVYGSATTTELCRRQGVPEEALHAVGDGSTVSVGPFTVDVIGSRHGLVPFANRVDVIELKGSGMPPTPFRWPRGDVFAYRVAVGGLTLHFQTSAGIHDGPLARQQPADVLIACLAARQGTPDYLDRLADRLKPKVLIPCHHDNFLRSQDEPPRPVARLDWPGFLDDAARLERDHGTRLVSLPRSVSVPI